MSPPSSCVSAAHSGSQAKTLSAACAGALARPHDNARTNSNFFMEFLLETVCAVGAQAHDVLQVQLGVLLVQARFVAVDLEPQTAEFAVRVVQHQARALRLVTLVIEYRPGKRRIHAVRFELVVA